MSIEIIKKPTNKCELCGCEYTFDASDFQEKSWRLKRDEISHLHYRDTYLHQTFTCCPICNTANVFRERKEVQDSWA